MANETSACYESTHQHLGTNPRRKRFSRFAAALLLLLASGVGACSVVIVTDENQCDVDADCAARGEAFAGSVCIDHVCRKPSAGTDQPWSCLGKVQWPSGDPGNYKLTLRVIDVIAKKPPEGLQTRLCAKLDVTCSAPIQGQSRMTRDGKLEVTVPAGFDGYVEMKAPSITTALFFVTRPVWNDTEVKGVVPVVSAQGFEGIAQAIGTSLDLENSGHVYALAFDCVGNPAAGVRLEVDPKAAGVAGYYMINDVPVGTAHATDAAGAGGFLNLKPGFTTVEGFVSKTGARIGETGFVVRKGAVSYPRLLPSP